MALSVRFRESDLLNGIAALDPRIESAEQRTDACNPLLLELQRHPGAGRFVGSSAVEDDVAITRNLHVAIFDLFRHQSQCTRDLNRLSIQPRLIA